MNLAQHPGSSSDALELFFRILVYGLSKFRDPRSEVFAIILSTVLLPESISEAASMFRVS
jgi:hypothetical protein